jgi:hypothetical protein
MRDAYRAADRSGSAVRVDRSVNSRQQSANLDGVEGSFVVDTIGRKRPLAGVGFGQLQRSSMRDRAPIGLATVVAECSPPATRFHGLAEGPQAVWTGIPCCQSEASAVAALPGPSD